MIHRFSARTRLAITEEKLLQQTLKHIEQCIEDDVRGRREERGRGVEGGRGEGRE